MSAAVLRYDAARKALAEARTIDEVKDWADRAAAIREYARRAKNRDMEIDAAEIRVRAQRREGELLAEMRAEGRLADGRKKKQSIADDRFEPVTLAELEISKDESSRAQKLAAIEPDAFERLTARCRERLQNDEKRHAFDVLAERDGPINGARSVMGSREEPDDSLDFFPTPPWATRALIERVFRHLEIKPQGTAWDPAAGEGHMAEVLAEYFATHASDIHDYGAGYPVADFVDLKVNHAPVDWIITNPPFGDLTEKFVLRAFQLAREGVAMFVRLQWLETVGRYEAIFEKNPPSIIAFFAERVNLCKGRWEPDGSTATAYIWLVWAQGIEPQAPFWIPPGQRAALTKPDDAERFTAHPVKPARPVTIDPDTGEIIEHASEAAASPAIPTEEGDSRSNADRSEADLRNTGGGDEALGPESSSAKTDDEAAEAGAGDTTPASDRETNSETSPSPQAADAPTASEGPGISLDGEAKGEAATAAVVSPDSAKQATIAALREKIAKPTTASASIEAPPDFLARIDLDKKQRTILSRVDLVQCSKDEQDFIGRLRRDTTTATISDAARLSQIAKAQGLTTEQQL